MNIYDNLPSELQLMIHTNLENKYNEFAYCIIDNQYKQNNSIYKKQPNCFNFVYFFLLLSVYINFILFIGFISKYINISHEEKILLFLFLTYINFISMIISKIFIVNELIILYIFLFFD